MACPFAAFAALSAGVSSKFNASKHVAAHAHLTSSAAAAASLSARLRTGTSRAHTAIERSAGVRALMGLARGAQLDSSLTRADYVAWLVALACVYAVLEAHLQDATPLLATLQEDATLLPSLLRTATLQADVRAHVQLLAGLDSGSATLADEEEVIEALAHADAQQHSATYAHLSQILSQSGATFPSPAHVKLLSVRFATNVIAYAGRLASLGMAHSKRTTRSFDEGVCLVTPAGSETSSLNGDEAAQPANAGLLLAHAYIRYMGDLSGGQHIAKRVKIIWPVPAEHDGRQLGYDFYTFTPQRPRNSDDDDAQPVALTTRFRTAMDLALARLPAEQREAATVALVDEASLAFDLNRGLFDALVDVETEEPQLEGSKQPLVNAALQLKSSSYLSSSLHHLVALAVVLALVAVGLQLHAHFGLRSNHASVSV